MTQTLLFPDPRPLVERLGRNFFRELPECAGVYLMRGEADALLYVGKAKNLRKRLGSYRVANPDRMPRRHLRLLWAVERIEIQECADEREAELLRAHRPRFNRAGTWPVAPKYLAWKYDEAGLHLTVTATPDSDWRSLPMGGSAPHVRAALVRLLWISKYPERGMAQMPAGWFRGYVGETVTIEIAAGEISARLEELFGGQAARFIEWIMGNCPPGLSLFERTVVETDLEYLMESFA